MDWLKARGTALNAAFGVRRYMLLPVIGAIIGFVDWVATKLEEAGMGHLIGLPSWAVGLFAAVLLGAYWLLEYAVRLRRQITPAFDLSFEPDGHGLVRTPAKNRDDGGSPVEEFEEIYVRVGVQATAKRAVSNCVPYLVEIRKKSGGNFIPTTFSDSMELPWSLRESGPLHLVPGVKNFVNVLKTVSTTNQLTFVTLWPLTLRNIFDDKTVYRLKILVAGEGVEKTIEIDVNWTGEWDRFSASLVADGTR
jgi:hypothetical protein